MEGKKSSLKRVVDSDTTEMDLRIVEAGFGQNLGNFFGRLLGPMGRRMEEKEAMEFLQNMVSKIGNKPYDQMSLEELKAVKALDFLKQHGRLGKYSPIEALDFDGTSVKPVNVLENALSRGMNSNGLMGQFMQLISLNGRFKQVANTQLQGVSIKSGLNKGNAITFADLLKIGDKSSLLDINNPTLFKESLDNVTTRLAQETNNQNLKLFILSLPKGMLMGTVAAGAIGMANVAGQMAPAKGSQMTPQQAMPGYVAPTGNQNPGENFNQQFGTPATGNMPVNAPGNVPATTPVPNSNVPMNNGYGGVNSGYGNLNMDPLAQQNYLSNPRMPQVENYRQMLNDVEGQMNRGGSATISGQGRMVEAELVSGGASPLVARAIVTAMDNSQMPLPHIDEVIGNMRKMLAMQGGEENPEVLLQVARYLQSLVATGEQWINQQAPDAARNTALQQMLQGR